MDYRVLQAKLDKIANEDDMQDGHDINLLQAVAKQIADDVADGDYTAIDDLFKNVSEAELKGFLSEQ